MKKEEKVSFEGLHRLIELQKTLLPAVHDILSCKATPNNKISLNKLNMGCGGQNWDNDTKYKLTWKKKNVKTTLQQHHEFGTESVLLNGDTRKNDIPVDYQEVAIGLVTCNKKNNAEYTRDHGKDQQEAYILTYMT